MLGFPLLIQSFVHSKRRLAIYGLCSNAKIGPTYTKMKTKSDPSLGELQEGLVLKTDLFSVLWVHARYRRH
jgi:hypothetical protein